MRATDIPRAVAAARSCASALGLRVDDAVVLHASNRIAVRLLPCDVLARVAYVAHQDGAEFEGGVARRLRAVDGAAPVPAPGAESRAPVRDGFVITLWTCYAPAAPQDVAPAEFAHV